MKPCPGGPTTTTRRSRRFARSGRPSLCRTDQLQSSIPLTITSEEFAMIADSVERMLDEAAPLAEVERWDREDSLPRTLIRQMAETGLCGVAIPVEYGGLGLT